MFFNSHDKWKLFTPENSILPVAVLQTILLQKVGQPLQEILAIFALNQWEFFNPYLTDGRVEISNILIENAIRPVAFG